MNVLVTGGAGYVGSHAVKRLTETGHHPVIFDNLERGHREVAEILGVPAVYADLKDGAAITAALRDHAIDGVMHFAAYAVVAESVHHPIDYYRNNVSITLGLLDAMARANVERFVFSSSCTVYGEPAALPVTENEEKAPVSPYGRSKLMVEQILEDQLRARPSFAYAALRYFNAGGCAMDGSLGEHHEPETRLIPLVLRAALGLCPPLAVCGTDYPTDDGTAIRDYVHVDDLADAHVLALEKLVPGRSIQCNLGSGRGLSVRQIISVAERVTGRAIPVTWAERRAGDASALYADASRARALLGWRTKHTAPEDIIASAWAWIRTHPHGYGAGDGHSMII
jgi:UDP-glucose 4-epimerase